MGYPGGNIQFLSLADAEGIMPAGTQVDVTFKYRVMGDPDPSGRPAIPVFFLQVNPDLAWAYSDPNPDLTDYPSKFWTDLAADMSIEVQDTFRLTVPTLSSAGDPALLIWFATNMTDPDLISYWYANVTISDIQLARVSQPRLSIRGHQSGVRFA